MALIIFLALINFTGVFASLVLIAYVLVFIFLIRLSKELDEYGYAIEIAGVQNSDKTVATICLGLAFLISLTGYVFFSRYPMEWTPQVKTDSAQIEEIKTNLVAQLTAPVRWTQSVQNMVADGATEFVELGPGKVLQGLVAKISREVAVSGKQ